jgi:hypothetical protein
MPSVPKNVPKRCAQNEKPAADTNLSDGYI